MQPSKTYATRRVALLTQHGKEKILKPILEPALHCRLDLVRGFDTDQLGTFSRELQRPGSQLDAARRKARIGMELASMPLGLASEGSFGPDPVAGILPWNVEYLIWIDDRLGIEVLGRAQGLGCHAHLLTSSWHRAKEFAEKIGFPNQQVVLRPDHGEDPRITKDIRTWPALSEHFRAISKLSCTGQVFIESDGRAHANPMRREMIRKATEDLLMRLCTSCPNCGSPGFGHVEALPGLPCGVCDTQTSQTRANRLGCPRCTYQETILQSDLKVADPRHCPYCNP